MLVVAEPPAAQPGATDRLGEAVPAAGGGAHEQASERQLRVAAWALTRGLRHATEPACLRALAGRRCWGDEACAGCWGLRWWSPTTARAWVGLSDRLTCITVERWWDEDWQPGLGDQLRRDLSVYGLTAVAHEDWIEVRRPPASAPLRRPPSRR